MALLDPDAVFRVDTGGLAPAARLPVVGAAAAARAVLATAPRYAPLCRPALVNGAASLIFAPGGRPQGVIGFTVVDGRIASVEHRADPEKLRGVTIDG